MLGPVSSHAAAEIRWAACSLESQPTRWQGILETTHRTSRRYEQNPPRLHQILIQAVYPHPSCLRMI